MTTPTPEELQAINQYTRRALTAEEVYVFAVTLCDNEIDRDFERFSVEALQGLATLFLGKTGIFDHNAKSSSQNARIFKTWIETDESRTTTVGEPYTMLRAKAYMVRTDANRSLIEEIEGGIKKEISVGCSMGAATCSICGADRHQTGCAHKAGKAYGSETAHFVLSDPRDAYEWSFVAVPAQREAGVTKAFQKEESTTEKTIARFKCAQGGVQLTSAEVAALNAYMHRLEQTQRDGEVFRTGLLADIEKYLLLTLPQINQKQFVEGCKNMTAEELQTLRNSLKAQADAALPPRLQLKKQTGDAFQQDNHAFYI